MGKVAMISGCKKPYQKKTGHRPGIIDQLIDRIGKKRICPLAKKICHKPEKSIKEGIYDEEDNSQPTTFPKGLADHIFGIPSLIEGLFTSGIILTISPFAYSTKGSKSIHK
jgi:hypothetical protein